MFLTDRRQKEPLSSAFMSVANSSPYKWPCTELKREELALVIIDMQWDFCGKGGCKPATEPIHPWQPKRMLRGLTHSG